MLSVIKITVCLLFLSTASAGFYGAKLRRDGALNMYPFPRVGRSAPEDYPAPLNEMLRDEYEPMEKRLISFPRVGRFSMMIIPSPARRADQTGMWFGPRVGRSEHYQQMKSADQLGMWYGPRVGRSFKNDGEDIAVQNEDNEGDAEQVETTHGK